MSIEELEQLYDAALPQPRLVGRPSAALRGAAARWSEAVWIAAATAGPLALNADEIELGSTVGRRPVFVCGVHRSGTTLVRDLLDDHPALAILPAEGTFLTNLQPQLDRLAGGEWLSYLGQEWLRRLANPINQRPYWLLGRTRGQESPYVHFARALMAWWPVAEMRFGRRTSSWPLLAVALAYAHGTGRFQPSVASGRIESAHPVWQRWGEKTPANERYIDHLESEFPEGKFIQVVRHPDAVYASRKKMEQRSSGSFRNARQVLGDLEMSYRTAADRIRRNEPDRFLLVRYEELIANPRAIVDQLAAFLDVDPLPILMQPTVAGLPTGSNSSFTFDAVPGGIQAATDSDPLPRADRERIAAIVGDSAAAVGYPLPRIPRWRARLLRLVNRTFSTD